MGCRMLLKFDAAFCMHLARTDSQALRYTYSKGKCLVNIAHSAYIKAPYSDVIAQKLFAIFGKTNTRSMHTNTNIMKLPYWNGHASGIINF